MRLSTVREFFEQREKDYLAPEARLAVASKGRDKPIKPCPYRTCFQRDRDRVIHSKAFRRLNHKTQVFISPEGDHYRTRLTHTIEVAQVARTIARALRLNEDLAEAISLGHDLGHTPFGHVGEQALRDTVGGAHPFKHNEQSLRVVELIEYEGKGLNLTWEVRDGILNHTGDGLAATLEGQIVRIADRIAYINHDIDDACRGGIISEEELPADAVAFFGRHHGVRISNMVNDLICTSGDLVAIRMSEEGWRHMNGLRQFLFDRVYTDSLAKTEDEKAVGVLRALFDYYLAHTDNLPPEFQPGVGDELAVRVRDYIAGMTDRYALRQYSELFMPRSWMV